MTQSVFALFYAIMFGATLNRLSPWSAFWQDNVDEQYPRWRKRVAWTHFWLTLVPAIYFYSVFKLAAKISLPSDTFAGSIWAVSLFLSVIALNSFYRWWVATILRFDLQPIVPESDRSRKETIDRYIAFGWTNYVINGLISALFAAAGLAGLFLLRPVASAGGADFLPKPWSLGIEPVADLLARTVRVLNEHSSLLLVAVTVILVLVNIGLVRVTAKYVELSASSLEEARHARERQAIPFITIAPLGGSRDAFRFLLRNDGNSVAIRLLIQLVNPKIRAWKKEGQWLKLPGSTLTVGQKGALSPNEQFEVVANLGYANVSPFMLRVHYFNVYSQRFDIRQPFERDNDGKPANARDIEFYVDGKQVAGGATIPPEALEAPELTSTE